MKKSLVSLFAAAVAGVVLMSGCTTVESTQKFNAVNVCNTSSERPVCQTHVVMTGYYFLGLPTLVGSAAGDGKASIFQNTLTTENVMSLLTREVKAKGATRLLNVQVQSSSQSMLLPFFSERSIQASGTGVRPAGLPAGAPVNSYGMP